jgi:hypothetical protein
VKPPEAWPPGQLPHQAASSACSAFIRLREGREAALACGETHVKKSSRLGQKSCYRIRRTKSFQLQDFLPIQACYTLFWLRKTTIFQPTDDPSATFLEEFDE